MQVIANILAWALIAPAGDVVIFKEVPSVVFLQGILKMAVPMPMATVVRVLN